MTGTEDLAKDYRVAFLHYLARRDETALHRGYELGRGAFSDRVSVLELGRMHHEVLLDVLRDTPSEELPSAAEAASEFLLAVLSTFDLAQRAYLDGLTGSHGS
jgi:Phosphoserine phosphatase RsbU, N-terminal domain